MNLTHENKISELYKKYPWLKVTTTVENYVDPAYYDRLLKDYVFSEETDLQLFEKYLEGINNKNSLDVLELGSGSGRATEVFLNHFKNKKISLKAVDLSNRMLEFCKKKFKRYINLEFIKSDALEFLSKDDHVYDVIFSLWSFSHSVHQMLIRDGIDNGRKNIQGILQKMVEKNMKKGSSVFIVHFDSMSDEQRILMQQWKKIFPIYSNTSTQSPSKLLIDEVLSLLENQKMIKSESIHYEGHEIIYSSVEEALEIFLNFHMESYFNESLLLPQIVDELVAYFENFVDKNGVLRIKPGCFIYKIEKI